MAEDLEEDFDEGEGSEESPGSSGRSFPLKKVLMIVLPLLLLIGGGGGLYFSGALGGLTGMFKGGTPATPVAQKEPVQITFMDLPEMLVNLQSNGRRQSFLKIRVALELTNPADQARVRAVMPLIVDSFQVYLRELRIEDLEGAAGMHLLREELLRRVNAAVKPVVVKDVLFREMLIQ
jgi:flagellar FliL protein